MEHLEVEMGESQRKPRAQVRLGLLNCHIQIPLIFLGMEFNTALNQQPKRSYIPMLPFLGVYILTSLAVNSVMYLNPALGKTKLKGRVHSKRLFL